MENLIKSDNRKMIFMLQQHNYLAEGAPNQQQSELKAGD
jgi:hypothetical protein